MDLVGKIAFILGLVVSVAGGVGIDVPMAGLVLAVLGLVVGALNISGVEVQGFLLAAIALGVASNNLEATPAVGAHLSGIIGNLVTFLGAAVLVVSAKSLLASAKD